MVYIIRQINKNTFRIHNLFICNILANIRDDRLNKSIGNASSVKCSNEDNAESGLQSKERVQILKNLGNNNDSKAGNTVHKDIFCNDSKGNAPNFHSFSDSNINKNQFNYIDDSYNDKNIIPSPLSTIKKTLPSPTTNLDNKKNRKINKIKDNIFHE